MTLSQFDDYPVHQIAEPIRHVGTSDRNFYDRYYFNVHGSNDDLFAVIGMGQYPNLGVTDAFVTVVCDGMHRVVRASRALGDNRMDTTIGIHAAGTCPNCEKPTVSLRRSVCAP